MKLLYYEIEECSGILGIINHKTGTWTQTGCSYTNRRCYYIPEGEWLLVNEESRTGENDYNPGYTQPKLTELELELDPICLEEARALYNGEHPNSDCKILTRQEFNYDASRPCE